jgi:hypothetical protein
MYQKESHLYKTMETLEKCINVLRGTTVLYVHIWNHWNTGKMYEGTTVLYVCTYMEPWEHWKDV